MSIPLGVSNQSVRVHLPVLFCDKNMKGLIHSSRSIYDRGQSRFILCWSKSASLSQSFTSQILMHLFCLTNSSLYKPSRTVKHASAHSETCWMSGQFFRHSVGSSSVLFFLAFQSDVVSGESRVCILILLTLNCKIAIKRRCSRGESIWFNSNAHLCLHWIGHQNIQPCFTELHKAAYTDQRRHFWNS